MLATPTKIQFQTARTNGFEMFMFVFKGIMWITLMLKKKRKTNDKQVDHNPQVDHVAWHVHDEYLLKHFQ